MEGWKEMVVVRKQEAFETPTTAVGLMMAWLTLFSLRLRFDFEAF
jgi:hypothetical protein